MSNEALNSVLAEFQGTVIDAQQDTESEIQALEGKYRAEIARVNNKVWDDGSMTLSFNLKIVETLVGNKGDGRYISKNFPIGETKFGSAKENMEKLLKNLKTMKIIDNVEAGMTVDGLISKCESSVGLSVNAKVRPDKDKNGVKLDNGGWPKHIVTLVEKFDIADPLSKGDAGASTNNESLPF